MLKVRVVNYVIEQVLHYVIRWEMSSKITNSILNSTQKYSLSDRS